MNKESIYKIIGYQGEYTNSVKKAIRKLLKENHPDNQGNAQIFQVISEVKKELETNKVSYKCKEKTDKNKKYSDIDYNYCNKMVDKIEKEVNTLKQQLKKKEKLLTMNADNYNESYRLCIAKEKALLDSRNELNKNQKNKKTYLSILFVLTLLFIFSILCNNIYLLLVFAVGCLFLLYKMYCFLKELKKIHIYNQKKVHEYVKLVKKIDELKKEKNKINSEINHIKLDIKHKENDLRFYHNLLN